MFVAFNLSFQDDVPSPQQRHFKSWLQEVQQSARIRGEDTSGLPAISIDIETTIEGVPRKWTFRSSDNPDDSSKNDQVLRLLGLLRESDRISEVRPAPNDFLATVVEGTTTFYVGFSYQDLERNLPLANLMKLVQVFYAGGGSTTPSAIPQGDH